MSGSNETDDGTGPTNRREVLRRATAVAAAAVGGLGAATGSAAAFHGACDDPVDEYWEYRCAATPCVIHTGEYDYQERHCADCNGDGTYDCSDWQSTGACC